MKIPTWLKVVLLPVTIPVMFIACIYECMCELGEGVWERIGLMFRREWY